MKLHEIIEANKDHQQSMLIESLLPYKNSLLAYYRDYFGCEPVLMVTAVYNAVQYAKIVPSRDFLESVYAYLGVSYIDEENTDSDEFLYFETINFNSIMLKDL